jgi:hypothetical protein
MISPRSSSLVAVVGLALAVARPASAQEYRTASGSRDRRGESALDVKVQFGVGDLHISPGPPGTLYRYQLLYDADHFEPVTDYHPAGRRLELGVKGGNHGGYHDRDRPRQRLDVSLSPATPTSLDLAFGAGTSEIELGGISVTDATVKSGASETKIRFSQPNPVACRWFSLEVGAIDLETEKLGNARCERLELKGAAGKVVLDLTGQWTEGATIDVEIAMGLGSVTLRLPESTGVEASVDRFLVSFDRSGLRRRGANYYSANWDHAKTKLRIHVRAAMGDIGVEWVK